MLLVKANEYKYQVLKTNKKNIITLPYEAGMKLIIYKTEIEIDKRYIDIDQVEVKEVEVLTPQVLNHDDYLITLELYVDEHENIDFVQNQMQATIEEQTNAETDQYVKLESKQEANENVLAKVKLDQQAIISSLQILDKVLTNKRDKELIEKYRSYLSGGKIKRSLLEKVNGGPITLDNRMQLKLDTVTKYLPQVEELLLDKSILAAEREMIIDYIYISRYKLDVIEYNFTIAYPITADNRQILFGFLHNSREFFNLLSANAQYTNQYLQFIASRVEVVFEIASSGVFEPQLFEECSREAIANYQQLQTDIKQNATKIYDIFTGGN